MANSFKVLVVDDNPENQEILKKTLSRLGCQVVCADSAEKGIEEIEKVHYNAVFTALCVREKGARGIARCVKAKSPGTKVFVITGWKGDLEQNILQLDGIHDVIRKPLIFNEIRDKLLEHLG